MGRTTGATQAHRPEPCLWRGPWAGLPEMGLDHTQEDMQDRTDGLRLPLQVPAQPLRHREHPLAHRQWRDDVIDQVRSGLRHAPCVAGRTKAPLAGESNQEVMAACCATCAGEAVREDAALEVTPKLPFPIRRYRMAIPVPFTRQREVGLPVLLDDAVQGGLFRAASGGVRGGSTSLCVDGHGGSAVRSRRYVLLYTA